MAENECNINELDFHEEINLSLQNSELTPEALIMITKIIDYHSSTINSTDEVIIDFCKQVAMQTVNNCWREFPLISAKKNIQEEPENPRHTFIFFSRLIKTGLAEGWWKNNKTTADTQTKDI